jgi:hypothetical protein
MVALGGLLVAVGFVIAIPSGAFPGSTAHEVDLSGGHLYRSPRNRRDVQSRRDKLVFALLGLGLMMLGALCIEIGS